MPKQLSSRYIQAPTSGSRSMEQMMCRLRGRQPSVSRPSIKRPAALLSRQDRQAERLLSLLYKADTRHARFEASFQ